MLEDARVLFDHDTARVTLASQTSGHRDFTVEILCEKSDRQLSTLAQIFTSSLPPVSTLEDLYIQEEEDSQLDWQNNIEIMAWLELLRPITGVKDLYLSKQFVPRIAPALQVPVGDRIDRSLARPSEYSLGGTAVGICPGRHCTVRCRATGHQSPYNRCLLGKMHGGERGRGKRG